MMRLEEVGGQEVGGSGGTGRQGWGMGTIRGAAERAIVPRNEWKDKEYFHRLGERPDGLAGRRGMGASPSGGAARLVACWRTRPGPRLRRPGQCDHGPAHAPRWQGLHLGQAGAARAGAARSPAPGGTPASAWTARRRRPCPQPCRDARCRAASGRAKLAPGVVGRADPRIGPRRRDRGVPRFGRLSPARIRCQESRAIQGYHLQSPEMPAMIADMLHIAGGSIPWPKRSTPPTSRGS